MAIEQGSLTDREYIILLEAKIRVLEKCLEAQCLRVGYRPDIAFENKKEGANVK